MGFYIDLIGEARAVKPITAVPQMMKALKMSEAFVPRMSADILAR